jgi:hypothetical protein
MLITIMGHECLGSVARGRGESPGEWVGLKYVTHIYWDSIMKPTKCGL